MGSYVEVAPMSNAFLAIEGKAYDDIKPSTTQAASPKLVPNSGPFPLESILPRAGNDPNHQSINDTPFTRNPPFPIEKLKGSLPHAEVDPTVDHESIVSSCLEHLGLFNSEIFTEDAIWRDVYALTGTLRTFNGPKHIKSVWEELSDVHHQSGFSLKSGSSRVVRLDVNCSWIQARFSFETAGKPETLCSGQIGIIPDSKSGWKIWLLTTILEEIKGFPSPDFIGPQAMNRTASEKNGAPNSSHFDCVVVGAGFAGLCLAGRLKAMEVHSVTLERNANVGDNWTERYDSARCKASMSMRMISYANDLCSPHIQRLQ